MFYIEKHTNQISRWAACAVRRCNSYSKFLQLFNQIAIFQRMSPALLFFGMSSTALAHCCVQPGGMRASCLQMCFSCTRSLRTRPVAETCLHKFDTLSVATSCCVFIMQSIFRHSFSGTRMYVPKSEALTVDLWPLCLRGCSISSALVQNTIRRNS